MRNSTKVKKIFALSLIVFVGVATPFLSAQRGERDSGTEYNLYERNRDQRDFAPDDYPNTSYENNYRNNNSGSYYQNDDRFDQPSQYQQPY